MAATDGTILLNDFVAQWHDVRDNVRAALERVGESGWFILGSEVRAFEAALAASWDLSYAIGCGNGLDAIEIGLRALGIRPGDKVMTTPLSAFATTLAIVRAGGTPVFLDVDDSGLIDLELCERILSVRRDVRFFVPVHLYGHAVDGERLLALKTAHQLQIVEDCAQAIGARTHGVLVGGIGALAATSFYPTKNLGAMGDGGAVLTSDAVLAEVARSLRDYGQSGKCVHSRLGMNSRLDELQAAILRSALLPRLGGFTARRTAIAETYLQEIRNQHLTTPTRPRGSTSVWHLFPILVSDRARFKAHLDAAGIGYGIHYPKLISEQEALRGLPHEVVGGLTKARHFAKHELSLPIHPYLKDEHVDRVVTICNAWNP